MTIERILKALANKRRLSIILILEKGELSVGEIAGMIKLSVRSTSKHLKILMHSDILEQRQKSKNIFYFRSNTLHPIVTATLISAHSHECASNV
jgi:DNA-binding transcriptional ArsR family regulator